MIVAMVGLTAGLAGEKPKVNAPGFKGGDGATIALPAVRQRLLDTLVPTGKPLAIVGVFVRR
ncbi:hypothetical protein [Sphingomonas sp. NPDC079357]|uniref:hypothetical protein n=1 Tax=Sphingomonas sp. NPDC079357 TaxID=3364518 RepID=UPI00384D32F4